MHFDQLRRREAVSSIRCSSSPRTARCVFACWDKADIDQVVVTDSRFY